MVVNIFIFILGAVIGSFLNVLIYRLPREESIVYPSSHCPNCKKAIFWYDNIPIVSFILLRGRCRNCGNPISPRYLLVEFMTGILFLLIGPIFGFGIWDFGFYFAAFFICLLIVAFFSDLETEIIPDEIMILGIPFGLLFNLLKGNLQAAVLGCALGYSFLFLISLFGRSVFKKDALGYGDVKLAALMGAWLLYDKVLLGVFLGYLIGAVVSIILLSAKIKKFGDYIPFGPYLATGAFLAFFWGPQIISYYLTNFIGRY